MINELTNVVTCTQGARLDIRENVVRYMRFIFSLWTTCAANLFLENQYSSVWHFVDERERGGWECIMKMEGKIFLGSRENFFYLKVFFKLENCQICFFLAWHFKLIWSYNMTVILIKLFQFPKAPTNKCSHLISSNATIIIVAVDFDCFESQFIIIRINQRHFSGLFVKIFLHCHTAYINPLHLWIITILMQL